jgi:hypothetical protein
MRMISQTSLTATLLYEHLLGLENHLTAVVVARAGPILHGRRVPSAHINLLMAHDSKDVVFLINGQMFSCKGSLEHVVQVRKDGQANADFCIELTIGLLYFFLCV